MIPRGAGSPPEREPQREETVRPLGAHHGCESTFQLQTEATIRKAVSLPLEFTNPEVHLEFQRSKGPHNVRFVLAIERAPGIRNQYSLTA
jgi:hypothetical protein